MQRLVLVTSNERFTEYARKKGCNIVETRDIGNARVFIVVPADMTYAELLEMVGLYCITTGDKVSAEIMSARMCVNRYPLRPEEMRMIVGEDEEGQG